MDIPKSKRGRKRRRRNPQGADLGRKLLWKRVEELRLKLKQQSTDETHRDLASTLTDLGQYDKAWREFEKIKIQSNPDLLHLARIGQTVGRWRESRKYLNRVLEYGDDAEAFYLLAVGWNEGKPFEKLGADAQASVVDCLQQAIELPHCPDHAFLWLCQIQKRERSFIGETSDAEIRLLQRGIDENPKSTLLRLHLSHVLISEREAFDAVEGLVAPLMFLKPIPPAAIWHLFVSFAYMGKLTQAIDALEKLEGRHFSSPKTIGYETLRGDLFLSAERLQDALCCFSNGVNAAEWKSQFAARLGRASILLRLGNTQQSIQEIHGAIELWRFAEQREKTVDLFFLAEPNFDDDHKHPVPMFAICNHVDELIEGLAKIKHDDIVCDCLSGLHYLRYRTDGVERNDLLAAREFNDHPQLADDLASYHSLYQENYDLPKAIHYLLRHALWRQVDIFDDLTSDLWSLNANSHLGEIDSIDRNEIVGVHKILVGNLKKIEDVDQVLRVFVPIYRLFWREMIDTQNLHSDRAYVAQRLLQAAPKDIAITFDCAYSLEKLGQAEDAANLYLRVLELDPNETAAINNLALIRQDQERFDDAFKLISRACEIAPEDERFKRNVASIERALQKYQEAVRRQQEDARRQDEFLRTAPERWPKLDQFKRQLLSALTVITNFDDWEHLSRLSGVGEQYLQGHWRKLVELGMIVELKDKPWQLNQYVLDLVKRERSHAVVTKIIHADDEIGFKPIFNSRQEHTFYNVMIGLFPNHLVFPNMALQAIFQYDRMKGWLDSDDFRYYLMAQCDCCVTSTANYLPIIGCELDSSFHDDPAQQERDARKNRIFQTGGVPLLRIRPHGQPTPEAIRNALIDAIKELRASLSDTYRNSAHAVNLELEIDFEHFGQLPKKSDTDGPA